MEVIKLKKKLLVLLMVVIMILSGCTDIEKEEKSKDTSMFVQLEDGPVWQVYYHRQTKVMYVMSDGSYNHGTFTVMLDANGKPLLYGN